MTKYLCKLKWKQNDYTKNGDNDFEDDCLLGKQIQHALPLFCSSANSLSCKQRQLTLVALVHGHLLHIIDYTAGCGLKQFLFRLQE